MAFLPLGIFAALRCATILFLAVPCAAQNPGSPAAHFVFGVVKHSLGRPLVGSTITLKSDVGRIIGVTTTVGHGLLRLIEARAGTYSITEQTANFRRGPTLYARFRAQLPILKIPGRSPTSSVVYVTRCATGGPKEQVIRLD